MAITFWVTIFLLVAQVSATPTKNIAASEIDYEVVANEKQARSVALDEGTTGESRRPEVWLPYKRADGLSVGGDSEVEIELAPRSAEPATGAPTGTPTGSEGAATGSAATGDDSSSTTGTSGSGSTTGEGTTGAPVEATTGDVSTGDASATGEASTTGSSTTGDEGSATGESATGEASTTGSSTTGDEGSATGESATGESATGEASSTTGSSTTGDEGSATGEAATGEGATGEASTTAASTTGAQSAGSPTGNPTGEPSAPTTGDLMPTGNPTGAPAGTTGSVLATTGFVASGDLPGDPNDPATAPVKIEMRVAGNYTPAFDGRAFACTVAHAIATVVPGFTCKDIVFGGARSGSIIVSLTFVAGSGAISPQAAVDQLIALNAAGTLGALIGYEVLGLTQLTPRLTTGIYPAPTSSTTGAAEVQNDSNPSKGLSGGAIAGIVVGCVVFAAIVAVVAILLVRHQRNRKNGGHALPEHDEEQGVGIALAKEDSPRPHAERRQDPSPRGVSPRNASPRDAPAPAAAPVPLYDRKTEVDFSESARAAPSSADPDVAEPALYVLPGAVTGVYQSAGPADDVINPHELVSKDSAMLMRPGRTIEEEPEAPAEDATRGADHTTQEPAPPSLSLI